MKEHLTAEDRPDKTGIALLQALHVLEEWEGQQITRMNAGYPLQDPPVHPYAWGLFKSTILKAVKDRQDLKDWSMINQFGDVCTHCGGVGKPEIDQNSEGYKSYAEDALADPEWYGNFEVGTKLYTHCTPCQGSGVQTRLDKYLESKG